MEAYLSNTVAFVSLSSQSCGDRATKNSAKDVGKICLSARKLSQKLKCLTLKWSSSNLEHLSYILANRCPKVRCLFMNAYSVELKIKDGSTWATE